MKKNIKIENLAIDLMEEGDAIRVITDNNNVILSNQKINSVEELIKYNFKIVYDHYKIMIDKNTSFFDLGDVCKLSISIVLHYLYMYNSWRRMYKKQENRSLFFEEKDFSHPSTSDLIFNYFRQIDQQQWEEKCSILLGINLDELKKYYKQRESYYNK